MGKQKAKAKTATANGHSKDESAEGTVESPRKQKAVSSANVNIEYPGQCSKILPDLAPNEMRRRFTVCFIFMFFC
jgi:hypothetical protein